ncbi:hypothetical protein HanIR_Chr08g0368781 [Helianthus annuus]|nr:hypothetical protein HanIR_Chr08g0368781 [Helianthus annuus]
MVCFFNCYMMIPHKTKRLAATLKWDSQFTTSWFYCSGNWGILSSLISYKGWYGTRMEVISDAVNHGGFWYGFDDVGFG